MKKLVATLLSVILLFSLAACGSATSPAKDSPANDPPASAEPTAEPVVEPQPEEPTESTYYGTWEAVSAEQNGISVSTEALKDSGNYVLCHTSLILRDDGKFCFNALSEERTGDWDVGETGILLAGVEVPYNEQQLALTIDNTVIYFEKESESVVFPGERELHEEDFYGTWGVIAGYIASSKSTITLADIKSSYAGFADSVVILSDNGEGFIKLSKGDIHGNWTYSDGNIQVDTMTLTLTNDLIRVPFTNGDFMYYEKVSDNHTIPEEIANIADETGLRPEFKEAMDSYEAFYTEYCDILKKYTKNPSDFSILGKYMELMGKLSDMDEKFEAWESEDLNNEELKYYMDVNNRVMKMLLDVTG